MSTKSKHRTSPNHDHSSKGSKFYNIYQSWISDSSQIDTKLEYDNLPPNIAFALEAIALGIHKSEIHEPATLETKVKSGLFSSSKSKSKSKDFNKNVELYANKIKMSFDDDVVGLEKVVPKPVSSDLAQEKLLEKVRLAVATKNAKTAPYKKRVSTKPKKVKEVEVAEIEPKSELSEAQSELGEPKIEEIEVETKPEKAKKSKVTKYSTNHPVWLKNKEEIIEVDASDSKPKPKRKSRSKIEEKSLPNMIFKEIGDKNLLPRVYSLKTIGHTRRVKKDAEVDSP
jgi:hypothetical protein